MQGRTAMPEQASTITKRFDSIRSRKKRFIFTLTARRYVATAFLACLLFISGAAEAQTCVVAPDPGGWPGSGYYDSAGQAISACEAAGAAVPFFNPSSARAYTMQFVGCIWDSDNGNFTLTYKHVGHRVTSTDCFAGTGQVSRVGAFFWVKPSCPGCVTPTKNLGAPSCDSNAGCGNPINVSIGNKYQRADDIFLSSLLSFSRHYNSGNGASASPLGPHWTHSYSRDLHSIKDLSGNIRYVVASRPSGEKVTFKVTAGIWSTDTDTPITLIKNLGSSGELLGWTYTFRDKQLVEEYDSLASDQDNRRQ